MKKSYRFFTRLMTVMTVMTVMTMFFFFSRCSGNQEKAGVKQGDSQKQAVAKKINLKKSKSILPKKLLSLELTAEQKAKTEALYKEIFTPEILAQRNEVFKKLKGLKKDSEEFIKLKKEIGEKMNPYNTKFNEKLKEILTPVQQDQYFNKKTT